MTALRTDGGALLSVSGTVFLMGILPHAFPVVKVPAGLRGFPGPLVEYGYLRLLLKVILSFICKMMLPGRSPA